MDHSIKTGIYWHVYSVSCRFQAAVHFVIRANISQRDKIVHSIRGVNDGVVRYRAPLQAKQMHAIRAQWKHIKWRAKAQSLWKLQVCDNAGKLYSDNIQLSTSMKREQSTLHPFILVDNKHKWLYKRIYTVSSLMACWSLYRLRKEDSERNDYLPYWHLVCSFFISGTGDEGWTYA